MDGMTTQRSERVPEWTLGDRLRKARSLTGLNTRDFASQIGVSHGTVTNAENDARGVRPITIKQWALVTNVSEQWLLTGHGEAGGGTPPTPGGGLPKPPGDKLAALTAEKRRRSRRGVPTEQYPLPSAA